MCCRMNSKTITPTPYDMRRLDSDAHPPMSLIFMTCMKDIRWHAVCIETEELRDEQGSACLVMRSGFDALSMSHMFQQFQIDVFIQR